MRVGLVVPGSLETSTGGYLYDRRLVEYLSSQGHTVEVVPLPSRSRNGSHPHRAHFPTENDKQNERPPAYVRQLSENRWRRRPSPLARRVAAAEFDVLIEDELAHPSLIGVNAALRGRACAVVALVHLLHTTDRAASPLAPLYAAVERRYLASVDAAVCNSDATRAAVDALLGRPLAGVVARPGCDHLPPPPLPPLPPPPPAAAAAPPPPEGSAPLRVLHLANVVPGKGLLVLLAALARLPRHSWRLTVVGSTTADPAHARKVRRQLHRLGLPAHVDLVGEVPNTAVPGHLAAAGVLAVPSSYEAAGIAYLEAMRFGVPVVATSAGGAGELMSDGCEGFLVAPGDVSALADRLDRLRADRDLRTRMGRAARRRADRHPTWEETLAPVDALLRSLAARAGMPDRKATA
ncbi:MAG: glycosyltransferase family 4 protein [Acidimicrobiia bacterium]|nr:glycosyltransferase family 4 protein [Acidimicrobiia bacterium]